MKILGYVIYGVGVLLTLIWLAGVRTNTKSGIGVAAGTVNIVVLFIVSLILVSVLRVSPFHLIWLFSVSVLIGLLSSRLFHTRLISIFSIPGYFLWRLVCFGIDTSNMTKRGIYGVFLAKPGYSRFKTFFRSNDDK